MNEFPNIDDNTHGMLRRIYVIEFPRKFTEAEMDVELTKKLNNELPGIFNWAIEGYKRLRDQKFIFSKCEAMRIAKKKYKTQTNSVVDFVTRCLSRVDSGESTPLKNMYERYQEFCLSEGYKKPFPKKNFRAILQDEGYVVANSSRHANQLRIFGVRYEQEIHA